MNEIEGIYDNLKQNVVKSRDSLLDQMDNIYNNFIATSRWFY